MRSLRTLLAVMMAVMLALGAASCGDDVEVAEDMRTGIEDPFELRPGPDGVNHVVGHGLVLEIPSDWVDYDEALGSDGSTSEWAVGQPETTTPFPAGIQFSAGIEGKGGQVKSGLAEAAKEIAQISPGYEFVDEGDIDVPGAQEARYLRFETEVDFGGTTHPAEQVSLFIQVDDRVSSTLRFIAPAGQWEDLMESAYDSVQVTT